MAALAWAGAPGVTLASSETAVAVVTRLLTVNPVVAVVAADLLPGMVAAVVTPQATMLPRGMAAMPGLSGTVAMEEMPVRPPWGSASPATVAGVELSQATAVRVEAPPHQSWPSVATAVTAAAEVTVAMVEPLMRPPLSVASRLGDLAATPGGSETVAVAGQR